MRRDDGGGITTDPGSGIGGMAPTAANQNPLVQGQLAQYSQLPTEKLQELAVRLGGSPQGAMIQRLVAQRHVMPQAAPTDQQPAAQASPAYARGGGMKRAEGGGLSSSEATPWWTRQEARNENSGFLHGTTPGRADSVATSAAGGSYVVPADVIAGLGQGNSLAGARIMDSIVSSGPWGSRLPHGGGGSREPRAPAPFREAQANGGPVKLFPEKRAAGGVKSGETPVLLSHGEYVIHPHHIKRMFGDLKRGHRMLDKWVVDKRKENIEKQKKLPGPVKT